MNPTEFVELANLLLANPREAAQRSAVSRGYYGAFHAAKNLIESCGFRFESSAETHEKLPWCMDNSEDEELIAAHDKLNSLRKVRNAADYELDDPRFKNRAFVALQVENARQILGVIELAAERKPVFCPKVRTYARDTLGKVLLDLLD